MTIDIINPTTEIRSAIRLLTHVVSNHLQRKARQYNVAAVCDPKASTLTLITAYANGLCAIVRLDVEYQSELVESNLCFEMKADFVLILLEKIKNNLYVKLEIDYAKQAMRIKPGAYAPPDLISNGRFAEAKSYNNELFHEIKAIHSLADYDFDFPALSKDSRQLFAMDIKLIKHLNKFNKEQLALASDYVSIIFNDDKIKIESTPFSAQLVSRCNDMNHTIVLDSNAFNVFQISAELAHLSSSDKVYLDVHETALVLHSSKVLIYQDTQQLVNQPLTLEPNDLAEVCVSTNKLHSALTALNSKQKRTEDIVSICFTEDEAATLLLTSEPEAGRLTRSVRVNNSIVDTLKFNEVFTHRVAFLSSLDLFFNEVEIVLLGLSDNNDEFFVTDKSRSKYAALKKLS